MFPSRDEQSFVAKRTLGSLRNPLFKSREEESEGWVGASSVGSTLEDQKG